MKFRNKFAVVTGASTGIGRAVAVELAKEGASVFLTARNKDRLNQTKKLVERGGGKAEVSPADLRRIESIDQLAAKIKSWTEKIDVLVNLAAVWHTDERPLFEIPFQDFKDSEVSDSIDVAVKGMMLLSKALIPVMGRGSRIINMSGEFDEDETGCLTEHVTKKAVDVFTKELAKELKSQRIIVNAIAPWYVWTEAVQKFWPDTKNEALMPEEVARHIVYLCSKRTEDITGAIWVMKKGHKPYRR